MRPIMTENGNEHNTEDQDITIERCPHDAENPYTMVSKHLIFDTRLSPSARWLVVFLQTFTKPVTWKELVKEIKPYYTQKELKKLIQEAMKFGYLATGDICHE